MSSVIKLRCFLKWKHVIEHPQFAQKILLLRPTQRNIIQDYLGEDGATFGTLADKYNNDAANICMHFTNGMKKLEKMLKN